MEMATAIILILALSVFTVQSAVLRNEDTVHTRVARSPCYTCEHNYGPQPSPVFRTNNWSGYARSADGSQQGVFSGAAAAAGTGNEPSNQAFSLAASGADSGSANNAQNDQSTMSADKNSHAAYGGNLQNMQSNLEGLNSVSAPQSSGSGSGQSNVGIGFEYGHSESGQHPVQLRNDGNSRPRSESSANAQVGGQELSQDNDSKSVLANQGTAGDQGQYQGSGRRGQSGGQSSGQYQGSPHNDFSANQGNVGDEQQQQHNSPSPNSFAANRGEAGRLDQNKEFGQNQNTGDYGNNAGQRGYQNLGQQKFSSHYAGPGGHGQYEGSGLQGMSSNQGNRGAHGQIQASGSQATSQYNGNAGQEQQLQENYAPGGYRRRSGVGRYGASEQGNEQSVLGGALDLASQGLKAAEGAQVACSTCGKNSYAISNAKSRSGSAVAVSVGG